MNLTAIDICSQALVKLGANPISSFEEETTEARVATQLYSVVAESLLTSYPWRFALTQNKLNRLVKVPESDFRYAYALPNDCIRILSAGTAGRGQGLDYRICGRELHTNTDTVLLSYVYRPSESDFPPFFVQALIARLAAEFCLPLTESTSRTDYLRKLSGEELQNARLIDSQQSVNSSFQDFSLIEVRQ